MKKLNRQGQVCTGTDCKTSFITHPLREVILLIIILSQCIVHQGLNIFIIIIYNSTIICHILIKVAVFQYNLLSTYKDVCLQTGMLLTVRVQ